MKTAKHLISGFFVSALVLGGIFFFLSGTASVATLAARTSNAAGVQVVVTPKIVDPSAPIWEFEVTMNTHTVDLNIDLTQKAVLIDDAGGRYAPVGWQGDPPGGHHRKGVLRFPLPAGKPKAIELKITGIGGPSERVFRWELK